MSIVKSILNVLSGGIIGEIGDAIDKNVTSTEEKMTLKNELARIESKAKGKTQDFEVAINSELTKRHQADMMSDSWLSKNVRPVTLVVLTVFTLLYIMFSSAEAKQFEISLTAIISLDMMVYGFYFGSRGVEKAASMFAEAMKRPPKEKNNDNDNELGW